MTATQKQVAGDMQYAQNTAPVPAAPKALIYGQIIPGYYLDGGEIVILALKPSLWFLWFVSVRWLLAGLVLMAAAPWVARVDPMLSYPLVTQLGVVVMAIRLLVALLQWSSRLYVLTNRRVMCCRGVMSVALFEASLLQIRHTCVKIQSPQKICGVGSIGFSLCDPRKVECWWEHVAAPEEVHDRIRKAIERAHPPSPSP